MVNIRLKRQQSPNQVLRRYSREVLGLAGELKR